MDEEFSSPSEDTLQLLLRLAISAGIGLLIGLEREFSKQIKGQDHQFAGIRTYTLVSILGYSAALAANHFGAWILAAAFIGLITLVAVFYSRTSKEPDQLGGTTEISLLLTFVLGALVFLNYILVAVVITVITLLLLTYKPALHAFVKKLTQEDVRAIVQFVIISALVLPFLPDKNFGPYEVWNLEDIWRMVVLVSGISMIGYLLAKIFKEKGMMVAGIVGGLVSSTAVTLSFSRRSKEDKSLAPVSAVAILAACTIMFPRILTEVAVINPELLKVLWIQIAAVTLVGFAVSYFIFKKHKHAKVKNETTLENPLNFSVAIKFALIYAVINLVVRFASEQYGDGGVYIAAIISGITDVDAITISMSKMARGGDQLLAANGIWLAAMSNTLVKFIIVLIVGGTELRKVSAIGFGSLLISGLVVILLQYFLSR